MLSPLPFGVHRVPARTILDSSDSDANSLHCLSAFTAFPPKLSLKLLKLIEHVSIAFRRSPRSRPCQKRGQKHASLRSPQRFWAFPVSPPLETTGETATAVRFPQLS